MLISKFPAAFAVEFLVAPCAFAQTETRLPEAGVSAPRAGVKGHTLLVTPAGPKTVAPLWAQPRDAAIYHASSPSLFDMSPLPRLRTARFSNS